MARPYVNEPRDAEIERLFRLGYTSPVLAHELGMTSSNVSRILRLRGVHRSEGGHSEQCRLYSEAKREHRFFLKHGVPPCRIGDLQSALLALRRYREQRKAARERKIAWELTFSEWWGIWESSGVWRLRGRSGGDSTMMTRIGDIGPYSIANVRIKTMRENIKESWESAPDRFVHRRKYA